MHSAKATSAVSAPVGGGLRELRGDVAPCWPVPPIGRHVAHQFPHIGECLERHDIGDDERPGQGTRPVRAGRYAHGS
jgi:hypothetical protein